MIVGKLKPMEEIISSISEFKNILILSCGSCVTVCLSGGDREAQALGREIIQDKYHKEGPPSIRLSTVQRQCEQDLLKTFLEIPPNTDAILSTACGAGVQTLAEVYQHLPIIPALNTRPSFTPSMPPTQPITGAPMATPAVSRAWKIPVAIPRSSGAAWSATIAEIDGKIVP